MIVKHPYDQYVAVSQATHRDLLKTGVDSDRAAVVYNGVDEIFLGARSGDGKLRAMLGLNEEDFIYLYFGRPGVTKGVDYLVKAAPLIQKEIPTAQLVLILAKEPLKQYERISRMARELCPGTNIHFVPPTPDREQLVRYLLDANCIVIPSITEGFGLTTVEACSLGIPVVATRAGAIPEVISGRHILIEPGSSEAICKGVVCAWKGQYDEWKPPKQFSWAKMVADYESVYKDTLERCM